jgi:hypothetical protein
MSVRSDSTERLRAPRWMASALASASFKRNSISAALSPSHVRRWRRGKRVRSEPVEDFAIKAVSIRGVWMARKQDSASRAKAVYIVELRG